MAVMPASRPIQTSIPSVDRILRLASVAALVADHGREAVVAAVRAEVDRLRASLSGRAEVAPGATRAENIAARVSIQLEGAATASLRPVFNLTGTVQIGRAHV